MNRLIPLLGVSVLSFWATFGEFDRGSATGAFCAEEGGIAGYRNCGYPTWGACRAAVSGVGGYCYANPQYVPRAERPRKAKRKSRSQPR